jgi:dTDP-4-amino-4,6-dideoxy-D-galactose acyltransferase
MTRSSKCEPLRWDSDFFGFQVARVSAPRLDDPSAALIDEWCVGSGVRCLYLLSDEDDRRTARVADAHGYRVVDVRVTLRHDLQRIGADGGTPIRDARPEDVPPLREIATRSHRDTRFYHDPGFSRDRCDALYATWVENAIHDPERWVLVAEIGGEAAGYQVIRPSPDGGTARMEILAVDEPHRGEGAGRSLLHEGLRRARAEGAAAVETATQERNATSLKAHLVMGFSSVRREVWRHKWFAG